MLLKGTSISRGIARGPAYVFLPEALHAAPIAEGDVGHELSRFRAALQEAENQLAALHKKVRESLGTGTAEIFSAQILILKDPAFLHRISLAIEQRRVNLDTALSEALEQFSNAFSKIQDPYFRERAADVRDVVRRLLSILASTQGAGRLEIPEDAIVVVPELMPSFAAGITTKPARALVSERGGRTGHAAILARTMGIPAVSGINEATSKIREGEMVIVDGTAGLVFTNPSKAVLKEYERLEREFHIYRESLKGMVDLPSRTRDGVAVQLLANIGKSADAEAALLFKVDGVGLFRTEFAFMIRDSLPTEEEQYGIIKCVAERLHPRPVVIRLLDIGGDKPLTYFSLPQKPNPALGERGIRLMLGHRHILESQMRAILRVSADHPVSILVPMVADLDELRHVRRILESAKVALASKKLPFNPAIRLGAMIETPAAALMPETLAKEADFFSLGTNDLAQYILAADRNDPDMAPYYQPAHPAVLILIRSITKALAAAGKELTICGDIAGDPFFTELLVGLGLRSFSMNPSEILEVKNRIRSISTLEADEFAQRTLGLNTAKDVEDSLKKRWQG